MKLHVSICCFLVSVNFAIFASCTSSSTNRNVSNSTNDKDRWEAEKAVFRIGLKMKNDKGELVELTMEEVPPPGSARRNLADSVSFYLYTRENPTEYHKLEVNSESAISNLYWSHFDKRNPTFFITHGWLSNGDSLICTSIRDAYLRHHNANVIIVDWGSIAYSSYGWAVKHVEYVSKQVAGTIKFLMEYAYLDPDKTTLVGHSLGAHVMGIAGNYTNGTIGTIFGLDPAYPMFSLADCGSRICDSDAKHVQIVHTNSGLLGFEQPIGTSDFYPNGGSRQASCKFDLGGSCSHARSYEFFAESINSSCGFYGKPCNSKNDFEFDECPGPNVAKMGGLTVRPGVRGSYYLWTNDYPPYAAGIEV